MPISKGTMAKGVYVCNPFPQLFLRAFEGPSNPMMFYVVIDTMPGLWHTGTMNQKEQYRTKKRIGAALRRFMLGTFPSTKYQDIFGCTSEFFKQYIRFQMSSKMKWNNFGKVWQLDHIVPLCEFDQTDQEDLANCWNFINIRPLLGPINKGRNSFIAAKYMLVWRKEYFTANPALDNLIRIAEQNSQFELTYADWAEFNPKLY